MINEVFLKALLYTKKKNFSQHNVYKLWFEWFNLDGLGQERVVKGMQFNI